MLVLREAHIIVQLHNEELKPTATQSSLVEQFNDCAAA
jgi:hypothetical protein